jgi:hypothetical protein
MLLCFAFQAIQHTIFNQQIWPSSNNMRHSGIKNLCYFGMDKVLVTDSLTKPDSTKFSAKFGNEK